MDKLYEYLKEKLIEKKSEDIIGMDEEYEEMMIFQNGEISMLEEIIDLMEKFL